MTAWPDHLRIPLVALAVVAAGAAMLVLMFHTDGSGLDYGTGIVPVAVPWFAATLAVITASIAQTRWATSAPTMMLVVGLLVTTGWSIAVLLFDALRVVRLVPLPLDIWGFRLRLLLVLAAAAALQPVIRARQARQGRCPTCQRWLPGPLARIPRWPIAVGVAFALPYPVMRVIWLLGGTLGTTGGPVQTDPMLQLVMATVGALLVALAVTLLVDRGPAWLRGLLGLGGLAAGALLAATFGAPAVGTTATILAQGPTRSLASDLQGWVFALFYSSWTLAGIGIGLGGLRYWIHRRANCNACGPPE